MKNVLTKILLLLLSVVMLASVCVGLASCDDEKKDTENFEDDLVDDENAPELPQKKFNENFVILGQSPDDFYVETAESNDIVEYEVYMRNVKVEEKYKIKIVPNEMLYYEVPGRVSDLIKANDTSSLDLVLNHIVYNSNIVTAGNAVDWNTVPYINFDDEWWPGFNKTDLMLNNKIFIAVNDLALSSITHTFCMYFNKELVEVWNKGDIYGYVNDGAWTYEKFLSCVTGVYKDLNKDQRKNEGDLYGLRAGSFTSNTIFLWGFDNPVFSRNANTGELECTFYSNKISRIAKNLVELYYKTDGVFYHDGEGQMPSFVQGQALFTWGAFADMMSSLRDMNGWGIIPLPKYNARQANYKSMLGGGSNALVAPKIGGGEAKLEKLGIIITELAYRSYKDVRVKLYDKALKGKYADDVSESVMVDLIYDIRMLDFGYIYMGFDGPSFKLQGMLSKKDYAVEQNWKTNLPVYNSVLEKVYEAFGLAFPGLN